MTFLFWNIRGQDLSTVAAELAESHDVDLLMFAESKIDHYRALEALNGRDRPRWAFAATPIPLKNGLQIYVRGDASFVRAKFDLPRASIREVQFPMTAPITLVLVHLPSPMYFSEDDRASAAAQIVAGIRQVEVDLGHTRTVVIGDLNMDPFSKGLMSADAFNAVMTRGVAERETRSIGGTAYHFFFNPTWTLFGDGVAGAPGTFFYRPPGFLSIHWRTFDQVLLRPRLMEVFDNSDLEIINKSKSRPLHDSAGRPSISDHFPLKFKLKL
jgi:Endonuclease/Exonuclease/phosphatase family